MDFTKIFSKPKSNDTLISVCAVIAGALLGCLFISSAKRNEQQNKVKELQNRGKQWLLENGCINCEATVVSYIDYDGAFVSHITVYDNSGSIIYRVMRVDPDIPTEYVGILVANTLKFNTFENPA